MITWPAKGRSGKLFVFLLTAPLLLAAPAARETAHGQPPQERLTAPVDDGAVSEAKADLLAQVVAGEWVGARLLCRKEEDNSVRCGKPVSFSVTFRKDRKGSSTDEHFPSAFTYRWKSKSEMVLTSVPDGEELTLFQLEFKEGFLTFQAYIYLAAKNPSLPREANYIHYIFDVHRVE